MKATKGRRGSRMSRFADKEDVVATSDAPNSKNRFPNFYADNPLILPDSTKNRGDEAMKRQIDGCTTVGQCAIYHNLEASRSLRALVLADPGRK